MKWLVIALLFVSITLAPAKHDKVILAKDLKCLVDNVYHEARGEPFLGQILVARTTINRAATNNICEVVYAPNQFSWTKSWRPIADQRAYQVAYAAAIQAFSYQAPIYYFHATYVKPEWARQKKFVLKEGKHKFYGY